MNYKIIAYQQDREEWYTAHCEEYTDALVVFNALCTQYLLVTLADTKKDKILLTYDNR